MTLQVGQEPGRESRTLRGGADVLFRRSGERVVEDIDAVFDILSSRRRRIVLDSLRARGDDWIPIGTLAERVAAWEAELFDPASVSVESIEIDLAHGHLPKMDDSNVIDYDRDRGRVSYRGDERVERFLDVSNAEGPLP